MAAQTSPNITISLLHGARGPQACFRLSGFLGPERFGIYKSCIEGARYESSDKSYRAPLAASLPILKRLSEAGFSAELTPELRFALEEHLKSKRANKEAALERADKLDAALKERGLQLYPYQKNGVEFLASRTTALLSDDIGLGKSCQTLTAIPENAPVVVVCPSVLKGNWKNEAAKWRPDLRPTILEGRGSFRWPQERELVIVNYDILPDEDDVKYKPLPGTVLVGDEGHALKNWKSKRTQRWRYLADLVRAAQGRTWILTATPLLNNPSELWAVLQAAGCAQECFGSYKQFFQLFGGYNDEWGGTHWAATCDESVPERLRRVSLRREKATVLPELPEKTYRLLEVPIDRKTKKLCDEAWEHIRKAGVDLESAEALAALENGADLELEKVSAARRALAVAKLPSLLELIEEFEAAGEPVIVFSRHRGPIDVLAEREGWDKITGDETAKQTVTNIVDAFQGGQLKGLALTIQAGGTGLTLTRACNVIFVDLDWTPALNEQAEGRALRIGQKNAVLITILVADHTMDGHVTKILRKKTKLIASSVEKSSVDASTRYEDSIAGAEDLQNLFAEANAEAAREAASGAPSKFQSAASELETWAANALRTLTAFDPDRAAAINSVGWNKLDGDIGASLTKTLDTKGGLTKAQWKLAIRLCRKYHRQVGAPPKAPASEPRAAETKEEEMTIALLELAVPTEGGPQIVIHAEGWLPVDGEAAAKLVKALKANGGLTEKQWKEAITLAEKYSRGRRKG